MKPCSSCREAGVVDWCLGTGAKQWKFGSLVGVEGFPIVVER